jgi:hypothetical protein
MTDALHVFSLKILNPKLRNRAEAQKAHARKKMVRISTCNDESRRRVKVCRIVEMRSAVNKVSDLQSRIQCTVPEVVPCKNREYVRRQRGKGTNRDKWLV